MERGAHVLPLNAHSRYSNTVPVNTPQKQPIKDQILVHPAEYKELVSEFDPDKSDLTSEQWLNEIETAGQMYGWIDNFKYFLAKIKLRGAAKKFISTHSIQNWNEFRRRLLIVFPTIMDETDAHIKMSNRVKSKDESYSLYFYDMLAMGRHAKFSDSAIQRYILNGIRDSEIRRVLCAARCDKVEQLLEVIRYAERNKIVEKHNDSKPKNFENSKQPNKERILNHPKSDNTNNKVITGKTSKEPSGFEEKIRCFNCNKHGHLAKRCPEPPKKDRCNFCRRVGHSEENCFRKGRDESLLHIGDLASEIDTTDFFVEVYLHFPNELVNVLAMIDTGSPINLLKERVLPEG